MEQQFRATVREARDRGRTVFLSSHQLAEVEAVCDRVGILRAGKLVEVADVADLRALHRTEVVAIIRGPVPDLTAVPGAGSLERDQIDGRTRLRFALSGPPTALLRALAPADVESLRLREPGLEEIFLGYYGDQRPAR
jgi:ABC-2 type transport system ATP-binding protein